MAEENNVSTRKRTKPTYQANPILQGGKLPPQAIDLEEAVLGALMLEKEALNSAIDILQAKSFYKEAHQMIFAVILHLFGETQPIDILTVTQELKKRGE